MRWNSGWDELIRPVAELSRYPAASRMSIISARVIFLPAARVTITWSRSDDMAPAGGCQRSRSSVVQPAARIAAARSASDTGSRSRKRRDRATAAAIVGSVSGPTAVRRRRAVLATANCAEDNEPPSSSGVTDRGELRPSQAEGGRDPDPAQVIIIRGGVPFRLDHHQRGEGLLDAGSPDSGGVVRDRGGGDVMPSGDVRERTSAVDQ